MKNFIHIGYPKNLSTSLQRTFFSKHPDISYLGIGSGGDISYSDDIVDAFFEHDVKYCRRGEYEKKKSKIIDHFAQIQEQAEQKDYKAFGASSEHLCISVTSDSIETEEKAARLAEVFGAEANILVFIRNQAGLIKSLYRESIRTGYAGTFDEFVRYLYLFKERNFIPDLDYSTVLDIYSDWFGRDNIKIFVFEDYIASGGGLAMSGNQQKLVLDLQAALGLGASAIDIDHTNKPIPSDQLERKRMLNLRDRHDLGNQLWGGTENHRLGVYWNTFLDAGLSEDEIFADVRCKRALLEEARNSESASDTHDSLYVLSDKASVYWGRLMESFARSNITLQAEWFSEAENLPECYFDNQKEGVR